METSAQTESRAQRIAYLELKVIREVLPEKVCLTSCVSYSDFFLCFKKLILLRINIISDIVI